MTDDEEIREGERPLSESTLGVRTVNTLGRAGILTREQLKGSSLKKIRSIRGIGSGMFAEIGEWLRAEAAGAEDLGHGARKP